MIGSFFAALVIVAALVFGITLGANAIGRHMTAENCHNWSVQTHRPTKFASYSWWSYGCLTPTANGKWVPTDQITGFAHVPGN